MHQMTTNDAPAKSTGRIGRWWWVVGIAICAVIVGLASQFASADPDGLERVAEDHGFIGMAENFFAGLLGDYAIPGIDNAWLATALSGLLGVAIVAVVAIAIARLLARRRA
jgi:hypothetical protein